MNAVKVVSLLVLFSLHLFGCEKKYESVRLMPEGFQGPVAIIYKVETGVTCPEEGGKVIYKIPRAGILKVRREVFYGNQENKFYYVDSMGKKEQIPYVENLESIDKKSTKNICFGETINSSELTVDGNRKLYKYTVFMVGAANKIDSIFRIQKVFLNKFR